MKCLYNHIFIIIIQFHRNRKKYLIYLYILLNRRKNIKKQKQSIKSEEAFRLLYKHENQKEFISFCIILNHTFTE